MSKAFKCEKCGEFKEHAPTIPCRVAEASYDFLIQVSLKRTATYLRFPDWCYQCGYEMLDEALHRLKVKTAHNGQTYITTRPEETP